MTVRVMVDIYEPKELRLALAGEIRDMDLELVEEDRREAGGDFVIESPRSEIWIERKTISDIFSSLMRNVYEHGKPKPEGRERRLFTQLLKLKGD
ncbi:MAG: hypothetical protein GXO25_04925, partial [Euryarchaeota archaeon]|nr:hypothetical protein [Euryarchaeota archaeon]